MQLKVLFTVELKHYPVHTQARMLYVIQRGYNPFGLHLALHSPRGGPRCPTLLSCDFSLAEYTGVQLTVRSREYTSSRLFLLPSCSLAAGRE